MNIYGFLLLSEHILSSIIFYVYTFFKLFLYFRMFYTTYKNMKSIFSYQVDRQKYISYLCVLKSINSHIIVFSF